MSAADSSQYRTSGETAETAASVSLGDTCGTCGLPANEVQDHVVDGEVVHEGCIPPLPEADRG